MCAGSLRGSLHVTWRLGVGGPLGRPRKRSHELVIVGFSILVLAVLLPLVQRLTAVRVAVAIGWWLALFLYEPIFVWRLGGTIGHRAMNLQVVDNGTEGPVSLPKTLARFCLKALLRVRGLLRASLQPFTLGISCARGQVARS